jgi:tRNA threonylcarbamoyladenosine biosynthesis protein TsaB
VSDAVATRAAFDEATGTGPGRPLLALETSTPVADVVVMDEVGRIRARRTATAARHSSNLLGLCISALMEAKVSVAELAGIACGIGPGSFTGLRVGMSVAKGLALPFDVPFLGISSLQALALSLRQEAPSGACFVPCLDGGKGQIFGAYFGGGEATGTPVVATVPVLIGETLALAPAAFVTAMPSSARAPVVVGGPGAALLSPWPATWQDAGRGTPSAEAIARLAWFRLGRGERDDLAAAVPVYGRAPDITTPKKRVPGV